MDNENKITEFFENPVASDYINKSDALIRRAVSRICSSSALLNNMIPEDKKADSELYVKTIKGVCDQLVRLISLDKIFLFGGSDKETIVVSSFVDDFTVHLKETAPESCSLVIRERSNSEIKGRSELLTYLLLSIMRNIICSSSEKPALEIGSSCEDGKVRIYLKSSVGFGGKASDASGFVDFFDNNCDEISAAIIEKLGAEAEMTDDALVLIFPEHIGGDLLFEDEEFYLSDERKKLFDIMLNF